MKERSIAFNDEMVRAIFDGRKTQTRRVIKPQPECVDGATWVSDNGLWYPCRDELARGALDQIGPGIRCSYGKPGDELWISEPRTAPRTQLRITDIRIERVRDISEEDAMAEGAPMWVMGHGEVTRTELQIDPGYHSSMLFRNGFSVLWDSINEERGFGWDINPWVWVILFERVFR